MKIKSCAVSDVGRVRQENQDSVVHLPEHQLFVVADGMGGHAGGENASRLAVEAITRQFDVSVAPDSTVPSPETRLLESIAAANYDIVHFATHEPSLKGMGTTIVALVVEGETATIASVGDSRAYRLRGGELEQLTKDHSLVADLIRRKEISEAEAADHPFRHVLTQALGVSDHVEPDVVHVELRPGDVYVLCSDGVYGMVEPADMNRIVAAHPQDPERLCRELVAAANAAGGKDNASVVTVVCLAD